MVSTDVQARHSAGSPASVGGRFARIERDEAQDLAQQEAEAEAAHDAAYANLLERDGITSTIIRGGIGGQGRFRFRRWEITFTSDDDSRTHRANICSAELEAAPTSGGVMRYLSTLGTDSKRREELKSFLGETAPDYLD